MKKKKRIISVATTVVLVLVIFLVVLFTDHKDVLPGQVIKNFYQTMDVGENKEIVNFFSQGAKEFLLNKYKIPKEKGWEEALGKTLTSTVGPNSVISVEIIKEEIDKNTAWLEIKLFYENDFVERKKILLIKESGEWKYDAEVPLNN